MLASSKIGAILFAVGAATGAARAYTIETHFTAKCHEKVTAQALRTARLQLEMASTPPATDDERALIDDLQFAPDDDMKDLAGVTLLVGVRDNDLKGSSQDDLTILSAIHGNPDNQREHCLRGPDQKEPGGSERLALHVPPNSIAERLQARPDVTADSFADVTVLIADVVGFTKLTPAVSPDRLALILDEIFTLFDGLANERSITRRGRRTCRST